MLQIFLWNFGESEMQNSSVFCFPFTLFEAFLVDTKHDIN